MRPMPITPTLRAAIRLTFGLAALLSAVATLNQPIPACDNEVQSLQWDVSTSQLDIIGSRSALILDRSRNVFVASDEQLSDASCYVDRLTPAGSPVWELELTGNLPVTGSPHRNNCNQIAWDEAGNLYVTAAARCAGTRRKPPARSPCSATSA